MNLQIAFYTWLARVMDPRGAREADEIIERLRRIKEQRR